METYVTTAKIVVSSGMVRLSQSTI